MKVKVWRKKEIKLEGTKVGGEGKRLGEGD